MHLHIKILRRFTALVLAFLLICGAVPALAAEAGYIRAKNSRVYASADLSGRSAVIDQYTLVEVLDIEDGVAKIQANGYVMYIAADLLTVFDEDDASKMVFSKDARVYALPSTSSRSAKISDGVEVNVLYTANGVAVVEKNGVMAYTWLSALEKPVEIIYEEYEVEVKTDKMKVYSKPSTSAKVMTTLSKGDRVTLVARTDEWALIEKNGVQGCCLLENVKKVTLTIEELFASEDYTNEEKIYGFMIYEMELSPAAACGILANIKAESSFRPTVHNTSDPYGGSYGICQWLGGRRNNLMSWCEENGYDYTSLEGQCRFMAYELEKSYGKVNSYIRSVENTAQGAYDAGHYWCYYYEIPANRASVAVKRGNMAKDDFWPKYGE